MSEGRPKAIGPIREILNYLCSRTMLDNLEDDAKAGGNVMVGPRTEGVVMPEWFPQIGPKTFEGREPRYKMVRVGAVQVLRCLFQQLGGEYLYLRSIDGLPEDAEVVSVQGPEIGYHPPAFTFLVFHPSFPVVANGDVPPVGLMREKVVMLKRAADVGDYEAYAVPVADADAPTVVESQSDV